MSNSFNISVKPEIAAAVVKIDANKTVIDENKVILVDVHDTDLPGAVTKITTIDTVVDNIRNIDVPNIQGNIDANEGILNLQDVSLIGIAIASDAELVAADTAQTIQSQTPTKKKEIRVIVPGTYRITFQMTTNTSPHTAHAQIYKNGVPYGTDQTESTGGWIDKSEDLSFIAGDLVQGYIWNEDSGYLGKIQLFKLKGVLSSLEASVILD